MSKAILVEKVRLKTVEELLEAGFRTNSKGHILYKDNDSTLLWHHEVKYCGTEVETEFPDTDGNFTVKTVDGYFITNICEDAIVRTEQEENLILKDAISRLKSGECDVIKPLCNLVIGAYLKNGILFKAIIHSCENGVHISYTDEHFIMHEEYLLEDKWLVYTDQSRKEYLDKCKKIASEHFDKIYNVLHDMVMSDCITFGDMLEVRKLLKDKIEFALENL